MDMETLKAQLPQNCNHNISVLALCQLLQKKNNGLLMHCGCAVCFQCFSLPISMEAFPRSSSFRHSLLSVRQQQCSAVLPLAVCLSKFKLPGKRNKEGKHFKSQHRGYKIQLSSVLPQCSIRPGSSFANTNTFCKIVFLARKPQQNKALLLFSMHHCYYYANSFCPQRKES